SRGSSRITAGRQFSSAFLLPRRGPSSTLVPYTTLFRSLVAEPLDDLRHHAVVVEVLLLPAAGLRQPFGDLRRRGLLVLRPGVQRDRKSTRLNSSHVKLSYADFCVKKKSNVLRLWIAEDR